MSSCQDYEEGIIKKHELTFPKKEMDRTDLCDVTKANAGPVFLTFREGAGIKDVIAEVIK